MKNRSMCDGKICWMAALVVSVMLSLSLPSCRHEKPYLHCCDDHFAQLDSALENVHDIDSLTTIVNQSHEQKDAVREMVALRHQGRRMRQQARFSEAIAAHERGLELATEQEDTIEMAMALTCLGDVNRRLGEMSVANGYYYKALQLCEKFDDQNDVLAVRVKAVVLNSIGNIEIDLCNFSAADSVLRRSLKMEEDMGRTFGIAVNYLDLGQVKRAQGELDSAWYYYRKSMESHQLSGSKKGVAMCHFRFGELNEEEKRFSHAIEEYTIAYDILKELGDTWQWLKPCLALARVHILMGEKEMAARYLEEAEKESRRIGSKDFMSQASFIHYELSLLQGDYQSALRYYIESEELEDSIFGLRKSDEMRAQRIAYQNSRKSGEVDVLNRDIDQLKRSRNTQSVLLALLLLMAGAIIASLVYAMRVRARTQKLMKQVEETRSLFFTNVVHQLRTPLSAIMGAIDGILTEGRATLDKIDYSDTQRENCLIIERQGNNLLMLVDRILEVGSVRSAITDLDWRTCDAVTFMQMILESYRERCVERHIELTYASQESNLDIDTVPRYLSTIVGSLIENAINYSHDYGKIIVATNVDGGMFVIRVADDGMGINKTDLPHVFEPFYRSAEAESLVEGVGIGLTVVRDMTMAMDGIVAVDSMKDHGSVFTVKLPCRHGNVVKQRFDGAVGPLIRKVKREQRYRQGKKIVAPAAREGLPVVLVVEDHIDVAHLVGLLLGDSYDVRYAADGKQGLAMAKELVPDLIITDVKMPLMDGIELCCQLRQNRQLCHIPVIMLSARNADADRVNGINAGADAYLVKPFVSEELRAWVEHLLKSRMTLREVFGNPNYGESSVDLQPSQLEDGDDAKFLEDFAHEVDKQFVECAKVDLDKVAHAFKMGESHLRRRIQSLTGKNVSAYITQLRMEKAMKLLQNSPSETLIGDIAAQCGFQDVAYFSRVFRQHYGMTPTQARNGNGASEPSISYS